MLGFFGFIFIFILLIIIMGVSILNRIIRFVFGFGKKSTTKQQTYNSSQGEQQERKRTPNRTDKRKIFSKDEGEYVDFEEIK